MKIGRLKFPHVRVSISALTLLILFVGCDINDGPTRYRVHGLVTFDGKPVPKGFITLEPDDAQGNSGPGGGAPIENGKFDTGTAAGVVGGPYKVRIVGYDSVPVSMEGEQLPDGQSLFLPFETTVDFPKEASEKNFDIPKPAP